MEWIFDGIGTALVSFIIGGGVGGAIGYSIGIKAKIKQRQKGGDNSTQTQIGNIINKS